MFFYQSYVQYLCDFNIFFLNFVNILPIILGNKVFVEINELLKNLIEVFKYILFYFL